MRKVLFYRWGSVCEPSLGRALVQNGIKYIEYKRKMIDYHADAEFASEMLNRIHQEGISEVFSYDYFPMISMVCQASGIPYISWIYDCPQYTLYSASVTNNCNYIYRFDRIMTERVRALGARNCFHLPLGVELREAVQKVQTGKYDVSFVGNLYDGEKNRLRNACFKEETKGFLEGLIRAQLLIYGYNFVYDCLNDKMTDEIVHVCQLDLGQGYIKDPKRLAADSVGMEVSAREREQMLMVVTQKHRMDLFTNRYSFEAFEESKRRLGMAGRFEHLTVHSPVEYEKEMAEVFASSRINLNITSKTIESGIPLRVFDIMACGGFCLTNYQPELAELFEDGEDLVVYTDQNDMIKKIEYYLSHEKERDRIAGNGFKKIRKAALIQDRVAYMFAETRIG